MVRFSPSQLSDLQVGNYSRFDILGLRTPSTAADRREDRSSKGSRVLGFFLAEESEQKMLAPVYASIRYYPYECLPRLLTMRTTGGRFF